MIVLILAWNIYICYDLHDSGLKFYEFHNCRDSDVKLLNFQSGYLCELHIDAMIMIWQEISKSDITYSNLKMHHAEHNSAFFEPIKEEVLPPDNESLEKSKVLLKLQKYYIIQSKSNLLSFH